MTALRCEGSHTNGRARVTAPNGHMTRMGWVRIRGALPGGVLGRGNRH
ncbi:MAG: hypothetical protein JWR34_6226 [Mycobacterium sp.]|jgi:hypothetical protein|nr:hypothetical protein [Mycobacterium sp.]